MVGYNSRSIKAGTQGNSSLLIVFKMSLMFIVILGFDNFGGIATIARNIK